METVANRDGALAPPRFLSAGKLYIVNISITPRTGRKLVVYQPLSVIPAQAGIRETRSLAVPVDPGLRRDDGYLTFQHAVIEITIYR